MRTGFIVYSDDNPARWTFALTSPIGDMHRLYATTLGVPIERVHWTWAPEVGNVYVVLASDHPVIFTDREQAEEYAELSGNPAPQRIALRDREDAAELLVEWREALA
jgi:hypothetical protein